VELATASLSLLRIESVGSPKKDCKTVPISQHTPDTFSVTEQKIFCPTSARRKVRPRAPIVIIPSPLLADNTLTYVHELSFENI
jgi:hypothetical protein